MIHRELSVLLLTEVRDPRVAGVTITDVDVTPDLLVARVFFSVMGDQEEVDAATAGLTRASGFLRSQLAGRVLLRLAPKLIFEYDRSVAYGRHIDELLDQIADQDRPGSGDDEHEPDQGD